MCGCVCMGGSVYMHGLDDSVGGFVCTSWSDKWGLHVCCGLVVMVKMTTPVYLAGKHCSGAPHEHWKQRWALLINSCVECNITEGKSFLVFSDILSQDANVTCFLSNWSFILSWAFSGVCAHLSLLTTRERHQRKRLLFLSSSAVL